MKKITSILILILTANFVSGQTDDGGEVDFQFETVPHNTLNRLRKIRNRSLYYWARTAELLGIK